MPRRPGRRTGLLLAVVVVLLLASAVAVGWSRLGGSHEAADAAGTGTGLPPSTTTAPTTTSALPPCPAHPVPSCVGVPPGTALTELAPNDDTAYKATTEGEVINARHLAGDLVILADGVTVTNSQIDGQVINEFGGVTHSFSIADSTVGPKAGCNEQPGIGETDYTADRVLIRNHSDGFRVAGDKATLQNSYVKLCSKPGDHSDGVQSYPNGSDVVIRNNTIDQRGVKDDNAPIFMVQVKKLTLVDNLVMGGTYTLRVYPVDDTTAADNTVRGNQVVNGVWDYGPADTDATCSKLTWTGNELVTIDDDYQVTSVVKPLDCPS